MVWFQFRRKNSNGAAVSIKEKVEVSQSKFGGLSYWPCCRKPLTEEETQQIKAEVTNHHEGFTVMHEHNCRQPNPKVYFCRDGDEIFWKRYEL